MRRSRKYVSTVKTSRPCAKTEKLKRDNFIPPATEDLYHLQWLTFKSPFARFLLRS